LAKLKSPELQDAVIPIQIAYQLPEPISGGVFDEVEKSYKEFEQKFGKTFSQNSIAILSNCLVDRKILEALSDKKTHHISSHNIEITTGELNGYQVYLVSNLYYPNEGLPYQAITLAIRILKYFTDTVLFATKVCSVNSKYKKNQILLFSDHVNVFGRNSLFGANESRWGVRFTDMSKAYEPTIQNDLFAAAKENDVSIYRAKFAHICGPVFYSIANAKYISNIDLDAICTGIAPEVCVARHMGLNVGCLGIVCSTIFGEGPIVPQVDEAAVNNLAQTFITNIQNKNTKNKKQKTF